MIFFHFSLHQKNHYHCEGQKFKADFLALLYEKRKFLPVGPWSLLNDVFIGILSPFLPCKDEADCTESNYLVSSDVGLGSLTFTLA